ncbi:replicative DNA helicase [Pseudovibrio japonicus]|uniref:Replicative DNA helicase n=1 Tax=Pseudovibrio japonicus TaxID=366534 RepID=A0ABQ3DZ35_9HYPH|nr:DNA helicase [Pseudovibrio japonicus]GHB20336.1 replicative DNA helicase [Pseudovibrio japonicus]
MRLSSPIYKLKRQAKLAARDSGIPLHAALDQLAQKEGYKSWSHLSSATSPSGHARNLLKQLQPGDLVLIAARPGQGKTLFGLELALQANQSGWQSHFFTLEYTPADVLNRITQLGRKPEEISSSFNLDCSDEICASYVLDQLHHTQQKALVVIDYLQLLDQKRKNPELTEQLSELKDFTRNTGHIILMISQVHRNFDLAAKPLPDLSDIRLPNSVDLTTFTKTCFLHKGEIEFRAVNQSQ